MQGVGPRSLPKTVGMWSTEMDWKAMPRMPSKRPAAKAGPRPDGSVISA